MLGMGVILTPAVGSGPGAELDLLFIRCRGGSVDGSDGPSCRLRLKNPALALRALINVLASASGSDGFVSHAKHLRAGDGSVMAGCAGK